MKAYFIRRLLLVLPTMLGITLLVFTVTRFAPGGPMDAMLQAAAAGGDGEKSGSSNKSETLSNEDKEELEEEYGYDKNILHAYGQWLGVMPKETWITKKEFGKESVDKDMDTSKHVRLVLKGTDRVAEVKIHREDGADVSLQSFTYSGSAGGDPAADGWSIRIESPTDRAERWARREKKTAKDCPDKYDYRAVAYQTKFTGLVQGDLGRSQQYGDTVISMIIARIPIALYFGILSTVIIYGTCIPLGVLKAITHRTWFDNLSSILIFIGYAIPGYALGALLVVFLGAQMGWFPIFGLTSEGFDDMSLWGQLVDLGHHTVLPIICYVISGFAFLTMLMKNNLMDNLSSDYVRTAMSKGVTFRKAVIGHAFRNSFIPIATGLGGLISLFVGGSMLIERVFDIQGFGMLQFQSVMDKDIPVIMGTLTISAFLMLLGNILSDFIVAMVDPRIKFN